MTIAQLDGAFPGLITPQSQSKLGYVGKETVDDFELGLKSTFMHHRVRVDVALFDTKYNNFQIQNFNLSSHSASPPLVLEAAGGAETALPDPANGGIRQEPELPEHEAVVPVREPAGEFAILEDEPDDGPQRQRALATLQRQTVRTAAIDRGDGMAMGM